MMRAGVAAAPARLPARRWRLALAAIAGSSLLFAVSAQAQTAQPAVASPSPGAQPATAPAARPLPARQPRRPVPVIGGELGFGPLHGAIERTGGTAAIDGSVD